jgi:predicted aspartyl protease
MLKTISAVLALLLGATGAAQADCKLVEVAKLPIELRGNAAFLDGKLRGQPIRLLVDTGASLTMFDLNVAKKAGLSIEDSGYRAVGAGGELRVQQATFDDWEVGGMKAPSRRLLLNGNGFRGFAGLLGFDFFSKFDVEINLKANELKLFQPQGCGDSVLAYWAPDKADYVEIFEGGGPANEARISALHIPVKINGAQFRASLDTGAQRTTVGRRVADYFGVSIVGPGKSYGADNRELAAMTHKFDTFEIGSETIKNPTMFVVDGLTSGFSATGTRMERRENAVDMLLGFDFMRTHRILIANSQHRVYFTYEGGQVFPLPQPGQTAPVPSTGSK